MKEYVITLHRYEDLDGFYEDMESPGGNLYIPNRRVDVTLRKSASRSTYYLLTDEEAEKLKEDSRVQHVELSPKERNLVLRPANWPKKDTLFGRTLDPNTRQWGFHRVANNETIYNSETTYGTPARLNISTGLGLGGNGIGQHVDVVVVDGLPDWDAPELRGKGNQFNWLSDQILNIVDPNRSVYKTGTYSYSDFRAREGDFAFNHGTHVSGTIVGSTQGWAPGANLYNLTPFIDRYGYFTFDFVKAFHLTKPVNPVTGVKNPTICNNSWAFFDNFRTGIFVKDTPALTRDTQCNPFCVLSLTFRGVRIESDFGRGITIGQLWERGLVNFFQGDAGEGEEWIGMIPSRVFSVDQDLLDLTQLDGVAVTGAAGNESFYIDVPGGQDFNNTVEVWTVGGGLGVLVPYHRGCSPGSASSQGQLSPNRSICVGAHKWNDEPAEFTNRGPRVDIFAPGYDIQSSVGLGYVAGVPDSRDNRYRQANFAGTSMACPEVSGVLALYAEHRRITKQTPIMNQQIALAALTDSTNFLNVKDQIVFSSSYIPTDPWYRTFRDERYLYNSNNRMLAISTAEVTRAAATAPIFNPPESEDVDVTEGQIVTFNMKTSNVPNGEILYWFSNKPEDTEPKGSFKIFNNEGTFDVETKTDDIAELFEYFQVEIRADDDPNSPVLVRSNQVKLKDPTVFTSLVGEDRSFKLFTFAPSAEINYDISVARTQLYEGATTVNFVVNFRWSSQASLASYLDTNKSIEVNLIYRNGATARQITSVKIDGVIVKTYNSTVSSTTSNRYVNHRFRFFKEGPNIVAANWFKSDAFGVDPSISRVITVPPTFSVTPNVVTVSESENLIFTIVCTNVPDKTPLTWQIVGNVTSGDMTLAGKVTVLSNRAQVVVKVNSDGPDNNEYLNFIVFYNQLQVADTKSLYGWIYTRDRNAQYTVTRSAAQVTEGAGSVTFTVTTKNVPWGAKIPYAITGSGITKSDFVGNPLLTGNVIISNPTQKRSNVEEMGGWRFYSKRAINIGSAIEYLDVYIRGNDVIVSLNPYWSAGSPTGAKLASIASAYKSLGFNVGVLITPFCTTHTIKDGATTETPAITGGDLARALANSGIDFVGIHPQLLPATVSFVRLSGQVFWTSSRLVSFCISANDVFKSYPSIKGIKILLNGYRYASQTAQEVTAHNTELLALPWVDEFFIYGKEDSAGLRDDPDIISLNNDFDNTLTGTVTYTPAYDGLVEPNQTMTFTLTGPAVTNEGKMPPFRGSPIDTLSTTVVIVNSNTPPVVTPPPTTTLPPTTTTQPPVVTNLTIAITSNLNSLTAGQTATITFTLSTPSVLRFTDITLTGFGSLTNFTGTGTTYTATFTPPRGVSGTATISVSSIAPTTTGSNSRAITYATATNTVTKIQGVAYTKTRDLNNKVDIRFPPSGTAIYGVMFVVYGGGWSGNDINKVEFDTEHNQYAQSGFISIAIDYRGIDSTKRPDNTGDPEGGQFPNNMNDVTEAIRVCTDPAAGQTLLHENINYFGLVQSYITSTGRWVVQGISAGGHLSVLAAMNHGNLYNRWPTLVVNAVGPMDLTSNFDNSSQERGLKDLVYNGLVVPYYCADDNAAKLASPRHLYGSAASPGTLYSKINAAPTIWLHVTNAWDNLVKPNMVLKHAFALPANKRKIIHLNEMDPAWKGGELDWSHNITSDTDGIRTPTKAMIYLINEHFGRHPNSYAGLTASYSLVSNVLETTHGGTVQFTARAALGPRGTSTTGYWRISNTVTRANIAGTICPRPDDRAALIYDGITSGNIQGTSSGTVTLNETSDTTFSVVLASNLINTRCLAVEIFNNPQYTGTPIAMSNVVKVLGQQSSPTITLTLSPNVTSITQGEIPAPSGTGYYAGSRRSFAVTLTSSQPFTKHDTAYRYAVRITGPTGSFHKLINWRFGGTLHPDYCFQDTNGFIAYFGVTENQTWSATTPLSGQFWVAEDKTIKSDYVLTVELLRWPLADEIDRQSGFGPNNNNDPSWVKSVSDLSTILLYNTSRRTTPLATAKFTVKVGTPVSGVNTQLIRNLDDDVWPPSSNVRLSTTSITEGVTANILYEDYDSTLLSTSTGNITIFGDNYSVYTGATYKGVYDNDHAKKQEGLDPPTGDEKSSYSLDYYNSIDSIFGRLYPGFTVTNLSRSDMTTSMALSGSPPSNETNPFASAGNIITWITQNNPTKIVLRYGVWDLIANANVTVQTVTTNLRTIIEHARNRTNSGNTEATNATPIHIAIFGDSVSTSTGVTLTPGAPPNVKESYQSIQTNNLLSKLRFLYPNKNIVNISRGGMTTNQALTGVMLQDQTNPFGSAGTITQWITENNPEKIVLRYGLAEAILTNDVTTSLNNLQTIIDFAKNRNIEVILIGVNPSAPDGDPANCGFFPGDMTAEMHARATLINNGIIAKAKAQNLKYANVRNLIIPNCSLPDGIHPRLSLGEMITEEIFRQLGGQPVNRTEVILVGINPTVAYDETNTNGQPNFINRFSAAQHQKATEINDGIRALATEFGLKVADPRTYFTDPITHLPRGWALPNQVTPWENFGTDIHNLIYQELYDGITRSRVYWRIEASLASPAGFNPANEFIESEGSFIPVTDVRDGIRRHKLKITAKSGDGSESTEFFYLRFYRDPEMTQKITEMALTISTNQS